MRRSVLDTVLQARAAKRPVALLTTLCDGSQRLFDPAAVDATLDPVVAQAAEEALRSDRSRSLTTPAGDVFIQVFNPPLRLIVVGAVHIAQPLAPMATLAGYEVSVVDPRTAFASTHRFPAVQLVTDWPDEAVAALAPDSRSAVVTLSHDPKLDDPALRVALASPAFFIGCLGSTRTHASRLARLRDAGIADADLARIHGPVGLAIGARSPAEIAVAIVAQMTSALRGGSLR